MKQVFGNSDCFHNFIHQTQEHGRNSKETIYWSGPVIYSYGNHYPMGRVCGDTLLLNSDPYSNTTAKHRSQLSSAGSHLRQIYIPDVRTPENWVNLEYLCTEFENYAQKQKCAFKYDYKDTLRGLQSDLETMLLLFHSADRTKILPAELQTKINRILETDLDNLPVSERRKKYIEREKEREKERAEKVEKDLKRFLNYEIDAVYNSEYVVFRPDYRGFLSSKRVRVPESEAKALLAMIESGKPVHGLKIANFTITSFDGSVLVAGCHKVRIEEINRVRNLLQTMELEKQGAET